ncbi:CCCH zinc finger protein [Aspergillus candidus]|uniref:C3H1-type domain-containing protein n=1 Tax=Aspergillus candidus TaxID=41067 RepID=A0A2I2F987_ASPCN|nr:hypothetical protein BDW47DRAFT_107507 [Aspergillus candidus]PLB37165.1 hypothetical protein BDW47DRAFT_107507 [Aspergillus candidus]
MTEEQDLLAKISQLAGQINRHKQHPQAEASHGESHHTSYVSRHSRARPGWAPYRGRPYARGRGGAPSHRNRTLVLNNTAGSATPASSTPSTGPATDNDIEGAATPNGWVAKRDRHMQLINSAIYDKEAQARTKAMEETRQAKSRKKAHAEQTKVLRYAQGFGRQHPASAAAPQMSTTAGPSAEYQVYFNDMPFRVSRGGSKLIRVSDDPNKINTTPKKVTLAGVTFVRSKNGNLHRLGAVTSKRKQIPKKKNELCTRFTTTGTCYKGPTCPYIHDPNKVAICKDFLQTGKCNAGISCDLSHEPSPHRSPTCMHFLRGRCANPECRYAHIRLTPGAPVCRDFANLGYCEKGEACEQRHDHECPDYSNTGTCNKKRCRLPHIDRAGQIRKNAAIKAEGAKDEDESDASSEEEEYDEIDSDDVDSDELDDEPELIEGNGSGELSQQQDYIRF